MPAIEIEILDVATGNPVTAALKDLIEDNNVTDYEELWVPDFLFHSGRLEQRLRDSGEYSDEAFLDSLIENNLADKRWNWRDYARAVAEERISGFAVEYDGKTQGLMLIRNASVDSRIVPAAQVLYVERLAIAPWNRVPPNARRKYTGVGSALMVRAIAESRDREMAGRLALHSLPGAIDFYTDTMHMVSFGNDPASENLPYCELPADQVAALLEP